MSVGKLLGRLRGNPKFLARVIAILILFLTAVVLVVVWGNFEDWQSSMPVILGGVLGTLIALIVEMIVAVFGKPDLSEIPMDVYESAKKEVLTTVRYYRGNCTIHIKLRKQNTLQVILESEVYGKDDGGSIMRAEIEPPKTKTKTKTKTPTSDGSSQPEHREPPEHQEPPKHQIDGREVGGPESGGSVPIGKGEVKSEYIESTFPFDDASLEEGIEDVHRWLSPISGGFTVIFYLPVECKCSGRYKCLESKYNCHLTILRGYRKDDILPTKTRWRKEGDFWKRRFVYNEALFSHQGFHWSIKKKT